ncbi:hypothetical protein O6H91_15G084200 [Diphasiastrum complanatum]|uniref:Uncharacterized protein n=1 Tax=Diphasiastrum complanatum TaxID=34168 RepID=A0ACC2BKC7_DIPCM|nr:hypothetical protein O6H91_15G084200 [Diphasiastrum complanatum]
MDCGGNVMPEVEMVPESPPASPKANTNAEVEGTAAGVFNTKAMNKRRKLNQTSRELVGAINSFTEAQREIEMQKLQTMAAMEEKRTQTMRELEEKRTQTLVAMQEPANESGERIASMTLQTLQAIQAMKYSSSRPVIKMSRKICYLSMSPFFVISYLFV